MRIGMRVPHNHLKVSMSNHTNFMSKQQLPLFLKAMLECIRQSALFRTLFYHKIKENIQAVAGVWDTLGVSSCIHESTITPANEEGIYRKRKLFRAMNMHAASTSRNIIIKIVCKSSGSSKLLLFPRC